MQITIIGPGRLGTSLALLLSRLKHRVILSGRSACPLPPGPNILFVPQAELSLPGDSGLIFITVPDGEISAVAERIAARTSQPGNLVHTSGMTGTEPLQILTDGGWRTGSFHPLQTFPRKFMPADLWQDISCTFLGAEELLPPLREIFSGAGLQIRPVTLRQKQTLHLTATLVSNLQIGLHSLAARLIAEAGLNREAESWLLPLAEATLKNISASGYRQALSGPLTRGDRQTISAHLDMLSRSAEPQAGQVYRLLSRVLLKDEQVPTTHTDELKELLK